ncbi:MAG: prefoldin subunit alpha [Thermoproteota archaeon]
MATRVEKQARRLSIEMRYLEETAEALQSRLNMVDSAMNDLALANETLEGLKGNDEGSQLLVPIGGNSYIKAKLEDPDKVIVGMGAGVSVEKTFQEAKEVIRNRKEELEETRNSLQERFSEVAQNLNEKRTKLQELASEFREGQPPSNV